MATLPVLEEFEGQEGEQGAFKSLAVWQTDETSSFARLPDAAVDASTGVVSCHIEPDSIVTLSSLRGTDGPSKGGFPGAPIPADAPFALPYSDDFEGRPSHSVPKYFSDNGGSFEVTVDGSISDSHFLRQSVIDPPIKNAWIKDARAITVIGESTPAWSEDVTVKVRVRLIPPQGKRTDDPYAGVCLQVPGGGYNKQALGHCLVVQARIVDQGYQGFWELRELDKVLGSGKLPGPGADHPTGAWFSLQLSLQSGQGDSTTDAVSASVGGKVVAAQTEAAKMPPGRAALISGWHLADFDDFSVSKDSGYDAPIA